MTGMKYIAFSLVLILCSLAGIEAQTSTVAVPDGANRAVSAAAPQVPVNLSGSSAGAIVTVTNTGAPTGGGVGVSGNAPVGYGLQGSGLIGVQGMGGANGTGVSGNVSGIGTGVVGQSNSGIGVSGSSSTGRGVYGVSGGYGVHGEGNAPGSVGVYGTAASSSAVYGKGTGANSTGVLGVGDTYGVFGTSNTPAGFAGYFQGQVKVIGALTVTGGCTGCNNPISDRNLKANFSTINSRSILTRLASIPIQSWNYKSEPETVRHIGPMAQDFRAAFGLGADDKTLNTVDASGVTMAAVQELYQMRVEQNKELTLKLEQLQTRLTQLERRVGGRARGRVHRSR